MAGPTTRRLALLSVLAALAFLVLAGAATVFARQPGGPPDSVPAPQEAESLPASPVMFIENMGQFASGARFQVRGGSGPVTWLGSGEIWLTVLEPSGTEDQQPGDPGSLPVKGAHVRLSLANANPAPGIEPFGRLDTKVSYFRGADPAGWHAGVPVWGGVRYTDLYPGIDLELAADGRAVAQRLRVADGADLSAVALQIEGATGVTIDGESLVISTVAGDARLPLLAVDGAIPGGGAATVEAGPATFHVTAPFAPAQHRPAHSGPEQDPGEYWGTYLGHSGDERSYAIDVDEAGSAYVTGSTSSTSFPVTPGAYSTVYNTGISDVFVTKFSPSGDHLIFSTFLGGTDSESGLGIVVDDGGHAYVTGWTQSSQFPKTADAFQGDQAGPDCFVTKLYPEGDDLVYSTYLGGEMRDHCAAIALGPLGNAYVTGYTNSESFPTTPGAYDETFNNLGYPAKDDAFVTRLNHDGSGLVYSTYLGKADNDYGYGIDVGWDGVAAVAGRTKCDDFPTTPGAYDSSHNGQADVFAVKFNASGSALVMSTLLGGAEDDEGRAVAIDPLGRVYLTGYTDSVGFPTTDGALDRQHNGGADVYVASLNTTGSELVYSTLYGGSEGDKGWSVELDSEYNAYVAGSTSSDGLTMTVDGFDTTFNGGKDAFVIKLDPSGGWLRYGTYLGGTVTECSEGCTMALGPVGDGYVTGMTYSDDLPTTPDAFDPDYNGALDAFVARLGPRDPCANPLPGGMCVYFGDLHSHTGYSDGVGTPRDAYQAAQAHGLDFFAVTDHAKDLTPAEWDDTLHQAVAASSPWFAGIRGFEWTSDNGHLNVFGAGWYASSIEYPTLQEFYDWLAEPGQRNAVAQFNHPNYPPDSFDNLDYNGLVDPRINLIEIANGDWYTHVVKYQPALWAGWHVASTNNSDTHEANWGERRARSGIVAPDLSFSSLLDAMRDRRVFSTEDENLTLALQADGYWMGSILSEDPAIFRVYALDPDPGDNIVHLEFVENGYPIDAWYGNADSVIWGPTRSDGAAPPGSWWYVKATQADGDVAYTAPIWTQRAKEYDIMIRDNEQDAGYVPSPDPTWVSPDIWVRHEDDHQQWHQNPIAGQDNTVHVRVHNIGTEPLETNATLYWADPSVNPEWPADWHQIWPDGRPIYVGPGNTLTFAGTWAVPDNIPEHACLLVHLNSPQDPLQLPNDPKWDNNVTTKNVHVVGGQAGAPRDGGPAGTEAVSFLLENPFSEDKAADLLLSSDDYPVEGTLVLSLTADLFDRWLASPGGGRVKGGTLDLAASTVSLSTPVDATLYELPLLAQERCTTTLAISTPAESAFALFVSAEIDGEQLGGNLYTTSSSSGPTHVELAAARNVLTAGLSMPLTATVVGHGFMPVPDGTPVHFSTTLGSLDTGTAGTQQGLATVLLDSGAISGTAEVRAYVAGTFTATERINIVTVAQPPVASFHAAPAEGPAPLTVVFTNTSTGDWTASLWSFGDGLTSTVESPAHEYVNPGVYTVTLSVDGPAGSDTLTRTNYITATAGMPVAAFSANPTEGPAPLTVQFTDESTGTIDAWTWDFGDGGTSGDQHPSHQYVHTGTFTVSLTLDGPGGGDTLTKTGFITLYEPAQAAFSADPRLGHVPLTVQFLNESTGDIDANLWSFGDGQTSAAKNPSHQYVHTGTYTVTLSVWGLGGSDTLTRTHYITATQAVMHVRDIRLRDRERAGQYVVLSMARIYDEVNAPVPAALVDAEWTLPDGSTQALQAQTRANGGAVFRVKSPLTGTYEICVTGVSKTGWEYDPGQNSETCDSIAIPSGEAVGPEGLVSLTPPELAGAGAPEPLLTYDLTVRNGGGAPDEYILTVEGNHWPVRLDPIFTPELLPGASAPVRVVVRVPLAAGTGDTSERFAVVARSAWDDGVQSVVWIEFTR